MVANPLLSVVIVTYNHAKYIEKCLDSVLMQRVDFPMEIVIAEDCSTDETLSICEKYRSSNPELIRIISSESNVGAVANEHRAFVAANGKYIATCEGDDYWTNPDKLQKQVDFLEANPDYSVCFHRYRKHILSTDTWKDDGCDNLFANGEDMLEISMHQFMHQWVTQYLTMVFRKESYDFEAHSRYRYFRDTHQIYHLLRRGRCMLLGSDGGVYQMTGSGEFSTRDLWRQNEMTLKVDTELWKVNKDKGWREMCVIVSQYMIDSAIINKCRLHQILPSIYNNFMSSMDFIRLIKNIRRSIK